MRSLFWQLIACLVLSVLSPHGRALAQEQVATEQNEVLLRKFLLVGPLGRRWRVALHQDPIEERIVTGRWTPPNPGEAVKLTDGTIRQWTTVDAAENGWLRHASLKGGYAYGSVISETERVMILEASGNAMVYVNGEPRVGDPYRYGPYRFGFLRLPVLLKQGNNELLFWCAGGELKARLVAPQSPAMLNLLDATLPDLIVGEPVRTWGGVVVINATSRPMEKLHVLASLGQTNSTLTAVPTLPALSIRKAAFRIQGVAPDVPGKVDLQLKLVEGKEDLLRTLDTAAVSLSVRRPDQNHKRTFRSRVDDSIQYYAVNPARPLTKDASSPALVLVLHGAADEATKHAYWYVSKSWAYLVAPTNRRPYGFAWEDWGRLDAMEVLELAQRRFHTDPQRTYVTGSSMGGHGSWHLGVTFPDRFAAIGPSASYPDLRVRYKEGKLIPPPYEKPTQIEQMLRRATAASDTVALARNLSQLGVYIIHGSEDEIVSVEHARYMNKLLAEFHRDFIYHEQPGGGHVWNIGIDDSPDKPGYDSIDWPAMFDFFARHYIPLSESVRQVNFITANPGVSSWYHWVGIEAQIYPLKLSSVNLRYDPLLQRFVGSTDNVARLALDLGHLKPGKTFSIELDGQRIGDIVWPTEVPRIWLLQQRGKWSLASGPSPALKGPHRYGPFKEVFRNRPILVYGTLGTRQENVWAYTKARYDAEQFLYRGNGSFEVVSDIRLNARVRQQPELTRNLVLYGNADTNAAWQTFLEQSPVQVRRGAVQVGEREVVGEELACLFIRPRPGSDEALIGVVAGTGLVGMRLTDRLPYFVSAVGYPDLIVFGPESLSKGTAGVRVAGFFGPDWQVATGEFAWQ